MRRSVFVTALTLVSALALAVVYGVGGVAAIAGTLDAGSIVTLALLLTRLYAPSRRSPAPAPTSPAPS